MANRPPHSDISNDDPGREIDRPPRMPRWLKLSGIVLIAVVLLVVGLMLLTGHEGEPGPGQHGPQGSGPIVQGTLERQ